MKNLAKIKFFLDFASFLVRLFFSYRKIIEKFYVQPPIFFHQRVHNKLNYKYTKFGIPTLTTHRTTSDQTLVVLIPPPPGLFRVNFLRIKMVNKWQMNLNILRLFQITMASI